MASCCKRNIVFSGSLSEALWQNYFGSFTVNCTNVRSFLCNELEPFSYLIYVFAVLLRLSHDKLTKYKVLSLFYMCCAVLLYVGIVYFLTNNWTYNIVFFSNILILSWYYLKLYDSKR